MLCKIYVFDLFDTFCSPDLSDGIREETGKLSTQDTTATLIVEQNDDPFGVFSFPATSRELSIAEDYVIGNESSTTTLLTVERRQGTFNDVEVVWEIFSYQIAGAGNLPQLWDLLFLGNVPDSVVQEQGRIGTGTVALRFDGCDSKSVYFDESLNIYI